MFTLKNLASKWLSLGCGASYIRYLTVYHDVETLYLLLFLYHRNPLVTGEFSSQRNHKCGVFFIGSLNNTLRFWQIEMLWCSCDVTVMFHCIRPLRNPTSKICISLKYIYLTLNATVISAYSIVTKYSTDFVLNCFVIVTWYIYICFKDCFTAPCAINGMCLIVYEKYGRISVVISFTKRPQNGACAVCLRY